MQYFIFAIFTISIIFVLNLVVISQTKVDQTDVPTVTSCQLNDLPNFYDGKVVRVSGRFYGTFEGSSLTDNSCTGDEKSIEFSYDCKTEKQCEILWKPINEKTIGDIIDGRLADVVVIGTIKYVKVGKNENRLPVIILVQKVEKVSRIVNKH
ncbi:MAG: hypothetical protein IPL32_14425 [Chloracidobacterium sp.]|nr:hypothetical protein [Chloracidobacterium sp.]